MKRSYKTQKEVLKDLETIFLELRLAGANFFPSERKLSEMVGASRETLRRSLEILESKQFLIRGFKSRILSPKKKSGLNVVFLTQGIETITNPTWGRLWKRLSTMSENASFNLNIALLNKNTHETLFSELSRTTPDVIVFSDFNNDNMKKGLFELKGKTTLIAVDEHFKNECDYCVCLDNFAVGELAAETLIKAGYGKPVFIGCDMGKTYFPFIKRAEGFASKLEAKGIKVDDSTIRWIAAPRRTAFIRKLIYEVENIVIGHNDSMFFSSDEQIGFAYEILNEHHDIPNKYGLITTVGSEESLRHNPVITSISHCDENTALALIGLIEGISMKKEDLPRTTLIRPQILKGETIRENK